MTLTNNQHTNTRKNYCQYQYFCNNTFLFATFSNVHFSTVVYYHS